MRRVKEANNDVEGEEQDETQQPAATPSVRPELIQEQENSDLIELDSVLRAMDDAGAKVRLYRLGEYGAKRYLLEMAVSSFSMEYTKQEFGGGKYMAQLLTGEGKFYKRVHFEIDNMFRGKMELEEMKQRQSMPMTQQPPLDTDLTMKLLREQKTDSDRFFMLMMQTMQENSKNTMAMIGKMFEGGRAVPTVSTDQPRVIDALMPLLLENIRARPGGPGLLDNVDNLLKLKELFGGTEEKEDMIEKLLKLGAPVIGNLMARTMPRPTLPPGAHAPMAQPAATAQPAPDNRLQSVGLPILLNAARRDGDPQTYYDFIWDNMPQAEVEQLITILEKPDWCQVLFGNNPEIVNDAKVSAWFEQLRQLFITPEPTEETETGHRASDTTEKD